MSAVIKWIIALSLINVMLLGSIIFTLTNAPRTCAPIQLYDDAFIWNGKSTYQKLLQRDMNFTPPKGSIWYGSSYTGPEPNIGYDGSYFVDRFNNVVYQKENGVWLFKSKIPNPE